MSEKQPEKTDEQKRDSVLENMLKTPPQPNKAGKQKQASKRN